MRHKALIFCLLYLVADPLAAASLSAQVAQAVTGDRLIVIATDGRRYRVRMVGIDAPAPDQPGGRNARRHLQTLLQGRIVAVEYPNQSSDAEIQGKVTVGGADMNLRQIQAGLARYRPDPLLKNQDKAGYAEAEATARRFRMGIWAHR